jgi:gluconolactonase
MAQTEPFHVQDERFHSILGSNPVLELLVEKSSYAFAHEAGIYIAATKHLFITSNKCSDSNGGPKIQISRVDLGANPITCEEISPDIPMGNGGVNWGDANALICGQGNMDQPSGIYSMSTTAPYSSKLLKGDFLGRPFNSVNDVVVHSDGSIWFTDPTYGFEQGYRPKPSLPSQVYRFEPKSGNIRAIADGFGHPNGICFSPDEKTVYITDTDRQNGNGTIDDRKASSMYVSSSNNHALYLN